MKMRNALYHTTPAAPRMDDIRQLTALDPIRSLLKACALPAADISETRAIQFYGIDDGKKLVAIIGLEKFSDVGLLRSLAVDASCRNRGLALRLVAHVERIAALQNIRVLYLLTTTAASFFEQKGFTPVARAEAPPCIQTSAQFAGICPASSTLMCKPLA